MAKTIKFCKDCETSHAVGECNKTLPVRRERKDREPELTRFCFEFTDPLTLDP